MMNQEELKRIKINDKVIRTIAGELEMELIVTGITENTIVCADYEFSRLTGGEIDSYLGWDGIYVTGSYLSRAVKNDMV